MSQVTEDGGRETSTEDGPAVDTPEVRASQGGLCEGPPPKADFREGSKTSTPGAYQPPWALVPTLEGCVF